MPQSPKIRSSRPSLLRLFRRDSRGTSAVEFALIAVPLISLLGAIFESGLVLLTSENLNEATRQASRSMLTGVAQGAGITTTTAFKSAYLCPATGPRILASYVDCSKVIIDVRTATSFSGQDLSNDFYKTQSTNQFCMGAPGTITVVRIAYPMPAIMPILQWASGKISVNTSGLVNDVPNDPGFQHLLVGTAIFETEPYPSGSYTKAPNC